MDGQDKPLDQVFTLEVAQTAAQRAIGLMHRKALGTDRGMLFVYPAPRTAAFWMKNTLIPLDILFFDENRRLLRRHARAIPHDETPLFGGDTVKYVIEIEGGRSEAWGSQLAGFNWAEPKRAGCPKRY